MNHDVFISYSRKDSLIANQICSAFDEEGISYFIDRQGIAGGMEFPAQLAQAICDSKLFLFLASENSYKSKFTNNEITFAFNKLPRQSLIPYIIDDSQFPITLEFIFAGINWRNIHDHPIRTTLIADIKKLLHYDEQKVKSGAETQKPSKTNRQQTMQYVDLGLSVKWATCNLGASSPEEYGDYYAWGEVKPRRGGSWNYDWNTAPYYKSGDSADNVKWSKYTGNDGKTILDPEDDAATVALGSPWRMPTLDEIKELTEKCTWTWTTMNGKNGYKVVGPNGNSIFLPAAGFRDGASLSSAGAYGGFWSSSLLTSSPNDAYGLYFNSDYHGWYSNYRYGGQSVRSVRP